MHSKVTIVIGPPGSGKTTGFNFKLSDIISKEYGFKNVNIWVLEPIRKIVEFKQKELDEIPEKRYNIKYINHAVGLSSDFYIRKQKPNDFIVLDEAHLLFTSEYRDFDVKTLKELFELYGGRLILMTATPKILESYLRYYQIDYKTVKFAGRLKRPKINIKLIPTRLSKYLTVNKLDDYDIVVTNNIKNLKKIEYLKDHNNHSYIFSTFAEANNMLFNEQKIKDNIWVGTCAMAQGIDKFCTLKAGVGRVLFDANTFKGIPDIIKKKYDSEQSKGYKLTSFYCMAEHIIQSDRFRLDLDELNIDVILDEELEHHDNFRDIVIEYINSVYDGSEVTFIADDGLYNESFPFFGYDEFKECIDAYNPNHTLNSKTLREKYLELLNYWCNNIIESIDKRSGKRGNIKSTLRYFKDIHTKFYNAGSPDYVILGGFVDRRYRNYLYQKAAIRFNNYITDIEFKELFKTYLEPRERKIINNQVLDFQTELYNELGLYLETLLQILFGHYGFKYSTQSSEKKRSGNPIQMLPRVLRSSLIVHDIDISACHVAAFLKDFFGNDINVTKDLVEKLYRYEIYGGRDYVIKHMQSFVRCKDKEIDEIEEEFGGERGTAKMALLWTLNRIGHKMYKDIEYLNKVVMYINSLKNLNIIRNISDIKNIGYWSGVRREHEWLHEYELRDGVIYRVADGLCQIYGNKSMLNSIKDEIIKTHKISMSEEDITEENVLELRTIDSFIQELHKELITYDGRGHEVWPVITDEMLLNGLIEYVNSLEDLRKHLLNGRRKGRAVGAAVGKAVGNRRVAKPYRIIKDFKVINTDVKYAAGVYVWLRIPEDIPRSYCRRFIKRL